MKIPREVPLVSGTVGDSILVLTRPDIRSAEELTAPARYQTADGVVHGRPGDIAMMGYGGEQWPIKRTVFLGTYKVLGRVGQYFIGERLLHVRRAWPVTSESAVFDYGSDRGKVPVARGGWIYQSDDNDYGTVNREVKHVGHLEIDDEDRIVSGTWADRYDRWTLALTALPPILSFLALLAFAAAAEQMRYWISPVLIAVETVLLIMGATLVWWIRKDRWLLKACIAMGQDLCVRYQVAVELLGNAPSTDFPGMSLWRCAQSQVLDGKDAKVEPKQADNEPAPASTAERDARLKEEIGATLEQLTNKIESCHKRERLSSWATNAAFFVILLVNVYLLGVADQPYVELAGIWLPALISATHSFNFRRRTTDRIGAMTEFRLQLRFVQTRLFDMSPGEGTSGSAADRAATLRLLCSIVAQHSQREFLFALSNEADFPV
ncbi:hypothetical protein [Paraburkholderia sp. 32]|uniref:hypothetical protein n=1 Tax=Paraburkholderia sp. 32 TaxID=2991057 RepID=UPI003D1F9893